MIDELRVLRDFDEQDDRDWIPNMVSIPVAKFESLLEKEIRIKVLLDLLAFNDSVNTSDIICILGNSELAVQLKEENKKYWAEYCKKKEGEKNENTETDA